MTNRRQFLGGVAAWSATGVARAAAPAEGATDGRAYWLHQLDRLAAPVLTNLARGTLKRNMPVEAVAGREADRAKFTHLEALGRLLAGIAPWLEVPLPAGAERERQQHYANLAREALRSATDPSSSDFLNFHEGAQPVVDAAFLAEGILRAPKELYAKLDDRTRRNLTAALRSTRAITPGYNNWLLFAAMVEAALAHAGEEWDGMRVDYALRKHQEWYVGDGMYGDGPHFHWDFYNSFVIQPMLVDTLCELGRRNSAWTTMTDNVMTRARRYAAIEERLIAPDGTYPAIGRSITYRCGAFHLLAQMALLGNLPEGISGARVRSALTAVMRQVLDAPDTFDSNGWLRIGLRGHQPQLGESYISTGSLYLCSTALLPLGLPPSDPFWSAPAEDWTSRRIWSGQDLPADHAI